ncbi:MAG: serine hydrolase [Lacrimispora sp.]|uniref:serine hydrolase domain-containing protein n=1 Tax=Lacrimispora sp. TaxID=2719234 RepID=UPI0039E3468A
MNETRYFPPASDKSRWRRPANERELSELCGINQEKLEKALKLHRFSYEGNSYGLAIIRHGYLAYEFYTDDMRAHSLRQVYSCTKAVTSLLIGMLIHKKNSPDFTLDSPAYQFMPEGKEELLADMRKRKITIRNLLSMSSGIPGEYDGALGIFKVPVEENEIDYVLGKVKGTDGTDYGKLYYEPGSSWDYSCPCYSQLGMIFQEVAGVSMAQYAKEKLFDPIGITDWYWEEFGGFGRNRYTCGDQGLAISVLDFAKLGYLLLNNGQWEDMQIIPEDYIKEAAAPGTPHNPRYGLGFWTNIAESSANRLPEDMYHLKGHKSNILTVIPSLDLVVARVSMGPNVYKADNLLKQVAAAIEK